MPKGVWALLIVSGKKCLRHFINSYHSGNGLFYKD